MDIDNKAVKRDNAARINISISTSSITSSTASPLRKKIFFSYGPHQPLVEIDPNMIKEFAATLDDDSYLQNNFLNSEENMNLKDWIEHQNCNVDSLRVIDHFTIE